MPAQLATIRRADGCAAASVRRRRAALSRELRRARAGGLHRPRRGADARRRRVSAHAAGNVLWTPRGGFLVTQECVSTPLIPIYLAAICTYATTRRRLILGVLATLPLFVALGILRLLVVALPAVRRLADIRRARVLSIAARRVVVFIAARWRHGASGAPPRAGRRRRGRPGRPVARVPWYTRVVTPQAGHRSTIRRARSRSSPRSRSVSISRCGSRPSSPLVEALRRRAGGARSRRPPACSRPPILDHPLRADRPTCAMSAAGRSQGRTRWSPRWSTLPGHVADVARVAPAARRPGNRDAHGADGLHGQLVHRPRHFERRRDR